jgi:hypothetical protein
VGSESKSSIFLKKKEFQSDAKRGKDLETRQKAKNTCQKVVDVSLTVRCDPTN